MMFWPFNHFSRSRSGSDRTIGTIYGMIVARAREPGFYEVFGVPDTVDGRFDLLVLHLWMVLRRLGPASNPNRLAQRLFDHFCSDMDANLREMGVGDLTVPKRMQKFGEAFYGRSTAYDAALATGHEALAQALCKNVLNGTRLEQARQLAVYVEATLADLSARDEADIVSGKWRFVPLPAPAQ
jgi:cytochrome b pre-mRNA-processing protein 3